MRTASSIHIATPRDAIFAMLSDVERWPQWLPHFRTVRLTGAGRRGQVVEMTARHSGLPLSWACEYWPDPRALELHFHHVTGWARGTDVAWTLTPTRDGTRVTITHDLTLRVPLLGWLLLPLVARALLEPFTAETLAAFKSLLEGAPAAHPLPPGGSEPAHVP